MLYFILSIVLLFACLGLIGGALLSMLMYLKKIGVLREKIDKAFYQMRHYEEEIKGHATNIEGIASEISDKQNQNDTLHRIILNMENFREETEQRLRAMLRSGTSGRSE